MRYLLLLLALLITNCAQAQTQVITALDDLWIHTSNTANSTLYGPSNTAGTWLAYQWSNTFPDRTFKPDVTPFKSMPCDASNTNCFSAQTQDLGFWLFNDPTNSNARTIRVTTSGQNQPCYTGVGLGGTPYEQDAFVGPNPQTGYPAGILAKPGLGSLASLTFNFTLKVITAAQNVANGCPLILPAASQQSNLVLAMTFAAPAAPGGAQTLFYQLSLGRLGFFQPARAFNTSSAPAFLYADNLLSYPSNPAAVSNQQNLTLMGAGTVQGMAYAVNKPITSSINILPVLTNIIATGGGGIDNVPADWSFTSVYFGHATYGPIGLITEWSNISLVAQ